MKKDLQNTIRIAGIVKGLYRIGSSNGNELSSAIEDFAKVTQNIKWSLAGGLAVGFHSQPRGTQDIDIIIENEQTIHTIEQLTKNKFNKHRPHALEHKKTGVEVEILTADFLGIDPKIVNIAIKNSTIQKIGKTYIPVLDEAGLIAMKLQRSSRQDLADIEAILKHNQNVNISLYPLTSKQKQTFDEIKREI